MNETRTLTDAERARLVARYPHNTSRPWATGVAVVVVSLLAVWGVWAGLHASRPGVHGQLYGYQVLDDHQVRVTLDVHRPDPSKQATCTVQAQAPSGETVGELRVPVAPSAEKDLRLQETIKTYLRAHTAIITACSLD